MDIYLTKNLPELETERLTLRKISKNDINDIYEYSSNPLTSKYLLWYPHFSKRDTKRHVKNVLKKYKKGSFYDYAVVLKESGKMIGTCGFTRIDHYDDKAEIGYVINPDYWGRGYATEAVKRVIDLGFLEIGLERIEARYIDGNERSLELMKRVKMTHEGIMRNGVKSKGKYHNVGVCSVLSNEYFKTTSKIK